MEDGQVDWGVCKKEKTGLAWTEISVVELQGNI